MSRIDNALNLLSAISHRTNNLMLFFKDSSNNERLSNNVMDFHFLFCDNKSSIFRIKRRLFYYLIDRQLKINGLLNLKLLASRKHQIKKRG